MANVAKHLPWVWQMFKFDAKRGPLECRDLIDKNSKYDKENLPKMLCDLKVK